MTIVTLKHNMIKELGLKSSSLLSVSKLFSYPNRYIPSRKRDSGCTNILHTGTLPSVRGEGQRLRKGLEEGIDGGPDGAEGIWSVKDSNIPMKPTEVAAGTAITKPLLLSLSSAAEIRHSGRIQGYEESPLPCLYS